MAAKRGIKAATRTAPKQPAQKLGCVFFRTSSGNEPVRDWLKDDVPGEARKIIGADIKTVQEMWPIGKPLVDGLGDGLWEVRSTHDGIEYRVIFVLNGGAMVLLHGFVKKTQKTARQDKDLAMSRKATLEGAK